jgi:hypothetical protein
MKLKTLICGSVLLLLVAASVGSAQTPAQQKEAEAKPAEPRAQSPYKVVIFDVKYRNPDAVARALVGSGAPGTQIVPNRELKTITVRDYPENILVIGDAIKRFDQPAPEVSRVPDSLDFELHIIAASQNSTEKTSVPASLDKVVQEMKATLKYGSYRYLTTLASRVASGGTIQGNGFIDPPFPIAGSTIKSNYNYQLERVEIINDVAGKEAYLIKKFQFNLQVPVAVPNSPTVSQMQGVGIVTELTLREGENAVVGTANVGGQNEAIIVVVTARKVK